MQNEGEIEQYAQLLDVMCLSKFMFFTHICQHFNELYVKLQGINKKIIDSKLHVLRNNIITRKYNPILKKISTIIHT